MKGHRTFCIIAVNLLFSVPVGAKDVPVQQTVDPDCACLADNQRWAQKQVVCIRGRRMMCGMSSNVSSWVPLNEDCQVSLLVPRKQLILH